MMSDTHNRAPDRCADGLTMHAKGIHASGRFALQNKHHPVVGGQPAQNGSKLCTLVSRRVTYVWHMHDGLTVYAA